MFPPRSNSHRRHDRTVIPWSAERPIRLPSPHIKTPTRRSTEAAALCLVSAYLGQSTEERATRSEAKKLDPRAWWLTKLINEAWTGGARHRPSSFSKLPNSGRTVTKKCDSVPKECVWLFGVPIRCGWGFFLAEGGENNKQARRFYGWSGC